MREKCPYSEFLWSVFSRIRTEYGDILHISLYPLQMRKYGPEEELQIRTRST